MPFANYLRFARDNARFVGFGFLIAFMSSFGQTYFIGVFGPSIQGEFDLSNTSWASLYLVGTIASALVLPWSGKLIDDHSLQRYSLGVALFLAVGCAVMASVPSAALLIPAVFMLRQGGQGLLSHISMTSMARYFDEGRGRAIALATLGFAAGEAVLPRAALSLLESEGWRRTFYGISILILVVFVPLVLWLLRGHEERHAAHLERLVQPSSSDGPRRPSWTLKQVLRDYRFYLLLPGVLAPAMILTALFFNHLNLAASKGWSAEWITGNYVVYAAASTVIGLSCGPLIDRIGAVRLVPVMLFPMAAGLMVAGLFDEAWSVIPYFVFLGGSVGISHTAVSAMWAEMYGVESIGAIKSLVSALAVLASALGPVTMGGLMDLGVSIETVCLGYAGYLAGAMVLLYAALRAPEPELRAVVVKS